MDSLSMFLFRQTGDGAVHTSWRSAHGTTISIRRGRGKGFLTELQDRKAEQRNSTHYAKAFSSRLSRLHA